MPGKVISGARAKLGIYDPATAKTSVKGIFNNVTYNFTYDVQPAYIIGRYGPAELDYTAMEVVNITCSGWRVFGHGAHVEAAVPRVQDLMLSDYITLALIDRQTEEQGGGDGRFATITSVRPTGYSSTISARGLVEVTITFAGIMLSDESTNNAESATSTSLP